MSEIEWARDAAADLVAGRGYTTEAAMIRRGDGDDFTEVQLALRLSRHRDRRMQLYEQALSFYSDDDFWNEDLPGGALVHADKGLAARCALSDKPMPFETTGP